MASGGGSHVRFARKQINANRLREVKRLHEAWCEAEAAEAEEHRIRSSESPRFKALRRRAEDANAVASTLSGDSDVMGEEEEEDTYRADFESVSASGISDVDHDIDIGF